MNKKIGLLIAAFALTAVAVLSGGQAEAKPTCNIACLVGQACCSNADCNAYCGGPGLGVCPAGGGCCVCVG